MQFCIKIPSLQSKSARALLTRLSILHGLESSQLAPCIFYITLELSEVVSS